MDEAEPDVDVDCAKDEQTIVRAATLAPCMPAVRRSGSRNVKAAVLEC